MGSYQWIRCYMKAYFFNSIKKEREKRADCKGGGEGNDKEAKYNMKNIKKGEIKYGN